MMLMAAAMMMMMIAMVMMEEGIITQIEQHMSRAHAPIFLI